MDDKFLVMLVIVLSGYVFFKIKNDDMEYGISIEVDTMIAAWFPFSTAHILLSWFVVLK